MKSKFFVIAMAAALTLPAAAQNRFATKADAQQAMSMFRHTTERVAGTTSTQFRAPLNEPIPAGMARVTLTAGDVWEDGTGYQMLLDADANTYGTIIPEVGGLSAFGDASAEVYAEFEYKIPENADGSVYTENIVLENSISILIPAGVYDYCITNPTPGDRIWIASSYGDIDGRGNDYEFVAGNDYVFSISLSWEGYDAVSLTVTPGEEPVVPTTPTTPEDLSVDPQINTANVYWVDEDDSKWNLRYRLYDPEATGAGETYFWDFENSAEGWASIDADGDGYGWDIWDPLAYGYETGDGERLFGTKCLTSASYNNYGALFPDNWAVTPEVTLGGELKFWAAGQDPEYAAEVFAVYVTTGDPTDTDSYVKISEDITATSPIAEYTFDLSEFAGQKGYIAFRHYNVTDMFRLNIDNVTVTTGGAPEAEWIYVNGIEDLSYTITGLEKSTTYEVQVQATDGQQVSDWTPSYIFTTGDGSGVEEVKAQVNGDNNYYNLMGQKMNANNLPAGIYIHNGRKVIVK
ncbi:MAG: DUF2436 domain-containing protein [Bacteroidales bacterium]|nr:DUF2436 domain-containing protein [Bacteroidales bacterium]